MDSPLNGLSVGAVAGHGIVDVHHGDDSGAEGDSVSRNPVGIPASIKALMVMVDDGVDCLEE